MSPETLRALDRDLTRALAAGAAEGLRQHVRPLRSLAGQVPALAGLAAGLDRAVRAAPPADAGRALLDLVLALVPVRTGLVAAGLDGPLGPVEPAGPWKTDTPAHVVAQTVELTTRPSQGLRWILGAALNTGEAVDLRLVGPLLALLDRRGDESTQLAAYLAREGLARFGPALGPELVRDFDPHGGGSDAWRLIALCSIDPDRGAASCRSALASGSEVVQTEALRGLRDLDPAAAEEAALKLLAASPHAGLLYGAALEALGEARSDAALETLVNLAEDPGNALSGWVKAALDRARNPALPGRLLAVARADAAAGRTDRLYPLLRALVHHGWPPGLRAVIALLEHPAKEIRHCAAQALTEERLVDGPRHGRRVIPALTAALGNKDPEVCERTVAILGRLGPAAARAVPALVGLLNDRRSGLRARVADALGRIGRPPEEVVPALVAALRDPSTSVRSNAAAGLGKVGPAAAEAVPALSAALRDPEADVRRAAAWGLGQIGGRGSPTVTALAAAAQDGSASVGGYAVSALARQGRRGTTALLRLIQDPRHSRNAAAALGESGDARPEVVTALVRLLRDPSRPGQVNAAHALAALGKPAAVVAVPALLAALRGADRDLRIGLASSLSTFGRDARPAIPALQALLADDDRQVRWAAAEALAAISPRPAAVRVLTELVDHPDPWLRWHAAEGLGKMRPPARAAVPALLGLRDDPDNFVRSVAAEALQSIHAPG
jgi:HEAT repeat protein